MTVAFSSPRWLRNERILVFLFGVCYLFREVFHPLSWDLTHPFHCSILRLVVACWTMYYCSVAYLYCRRYCPYYRVLTSNGAKFGVGLSDHFTFPQRSYSGRLLLSFIEQLALSVLHYLFWRVHLKPVPCYDSCYNLETGRSCTGSSSLVRWRLHHCCSYAEHLACPFVSDLTLSVRP